MEPPTGADSYRKPVVGTTLCHSGARRRREPGTHDGVRHSKPRCGQLTRSWVPGSSLREAPE